MRATPCLNFFLGGGGGGVKFLRHDTHKYNFILFAVNLRFSQKVLFFLLSLQNFGVFSRGTQQSQHPKNFTAP